MTYAKTFALVAVAAFVAFILHDLVPGAWWQWLAVSAFMLLTATIAAGIATSSIDRKEGK